MLQPIDAFVVERAGGADVLSDWIELLRRFARDSNFVEFYREQQPFYQTMVDRDEETVSQVDYVDQLETYSASPRLLYDHLGAIYTIPRRLWPSSRAWSRLL